MTDPQEAATDPANLIGPGDPDAVDPKQPRPGGGTAKNIREEQQTQAAGTVPASYVGSGEPDAERKPEDAAEGAGTWDDQV
ncbi:hypothetical protein TV39_18520 [Arthrobacter sp. SPG23]|uniref:hypothetical protein n=1 Tax=Arthrobacter sp. SPG23 TaxID=1610703 RepID=UPI0005B7FE79|nr:hypothetical protein [Arthrobacter sp. SPG23]KIS26012.1 hypothetical protein TV39_18520 [Arthrobacter sp. SPG23]